MENPFEEAGKYGYRFLVARMADDLPYTGRIVELVVSDHTATLSQAAQWALAGAGPRLSGQEPQPASISGLTGWLLIYSPGYVYESGLIYQDGRMQPSQVILQSNEKVAYKESSQGKFLVTTTCVTSTICGTVTVANSGNPSTNCVNSTNCHSSIASINDWESSGGGTSDGGGASGWGGTIAVS